MLTNRDKQLLKFIENYGGISTQQATNIFFDSLRESATRRLNHFEKLKELESYYIGKNKIYKLLGTKEMKEHEKIKLDFYSWIYKNDGEVIEFQLEPKLLNGLLRPDIYTEFKMDYEGEKYLIKAYVEIDLNHYTDVDKIRTLYQKFYNENEGEWLLIIARPTRGLMFSPNDFDVLYTDIHFNNLKHLIFQ